jgi:DNA-binding CsgD family transcriptional regulator
MPRWAEGSAASRRYERDLAALLALPAMWTGNEPTSIVDGLLDVINNLFFPYCAYARFDDPAGGIAIQRWRPDGEELPHVLTNLIAATPPDRTELTVSVIESSTDAPIRVASIHPTLPGENGLVLVGSQRADFPTELERFMLRIAVSQAVVSIHSSRLLMYERTARAAAEQEVERSNEALRTMADHLVATISTISAIAVQARQHAAQPVPIVEDLGMLLEAESRTGAANLAAFNMTFVASSRLTRREGEVMGLLAQGMSNKEIAAEFSLSERTVERHITGLYRKIGAQRRTDAIAFAQRYGFLHTEQTET